MKEDIIDLVSDGEESSEDSPDIKPKVSPVIKIDKNNTSERVLLDARRNSFKDQRDAKEGTGKKVQSKATSSFLGGNPVVQKDATILQGKDLNRRFWKAGDYEVHTTSNKVMPNGMDHVRVHPKFLHSNATSHKWALGAIAELLDNAIDEVANGATYVSVDKVANSQDNSPMLQIQDDGGGMDPDNLRHCMSLGYSRKASNTTIGQYGNGFKTSTMRLGADVIVFSRCSRNRCSTQTIGLLSYTFLRATGHEDIIVPMVDFDLSQGSRKPKMLVRSTKEDWLNNLSTILRWSPCLSEAELMKQFDDLGPHGTKILVYNLWMNDDGELELDFDSDKQDIQVRGAEKMEKCDTLQKQLTSQHIMNRLRYSLRAYCSILYLRMPSNFQVNLRGAVVEHLSIAEDLKFPERILYKPQIGNAKDISSKEVSVITTIGFAKEAPMVNVHGFNVYHKNRLIMPFWKVFQENSSRGRGVVGVLEANFIEPAHDKQDFEKTPILQRLETRLKQMTIEYWNLHCELIGYQPPKQSSKPRPSNAPSVATIDIPGMKTWEANNGLRSSHEVRQGETSAPSTPPQPGSDSETNSEKVVDQKPVASISVNEVDGAKCQGKTCKLSTHSGESVFGKRELANANFPGAVKRQKICVESEATSNKAIIAYRSGAVSGPTTSDLNLEVLEELDELRTRCSEYQRREVELKSKVSGLELELLEFKRKFKALVGKQTELKKPKEEC